MVVVRAALSDVQGELKRAVSNKIALDATLDGTQIESNQTCTGYNELLVSMHSELERTYVEFSLRRG